MIRKLINKCTEISTEEKNLIKFVRSLDLPTGHKILDVGCGFGAKLQLLRASGFNVVGVETNDDMVAANLKAGLKCMHVEDFSRTADLYDLILMSHVIEHFPPDGLLKFLDGYLDRLKTGGHLIITTPLLSPYFYEDFDHVKPYHPTGINMVFGNTSAQVQYYSRNKIDLEDLWFRKGPLKILFSSGLYTGKGVRIPTIANIALAVLFRLSLGLIGRTDGWMGLYKKTSS
jgi:SAM-dependent methyltransferase